MNPSRPCPSHRRVCYNSFWRRPVPPPRLVRGPAGLDFWGAVSLHFPSQYGARIGLGWYYVRYVAGDKNSFMSTLLQAFSPLVSLSFTHFSSFMRCSVVCDSVLLDVRKIAFMRCSVVCDGVLLDVREIVILRAGTRYQVRTYDTYVIVSNILVVQSILTGLSANISTLPVLRMRSWKCTYRNDYCLTCSLYIRKTRAQQAQQAYLNETTNAHLQLHVSVSTLLSLYLKMPRVHSGA